MQQLNTYSVLTELEATFENTVMFFGFAFVTKQELRKNLSDLYKSFPREIVGKGKSYLAAQKLENICMKRFSIGEISVVFKSQALNYIDEIYSYLPQDIKDFC